MMKRAGKYHHQPIIAYAQLRAHASGKRRRYRDAAENDYYDYYDAIGAFSVG